MFGIASVFSATVRIEGKKLFVDIVTNIVGLFEWEACVNGALASKLDVHINIGVIIVNIYILGYTGVGKGQWPGEWGGPASGELL